MSAERERIIEALAAKYQQARDDLDFSTDNFRREAQDVGRGTHPSTTYLGHTMESYRSRLTTFSAVVSTIEAAGLLDEALALLRRRAGERVAS